MAFAVLTRALEAESPYATALAPLGLEVVAMPVTRTAPPRDASALARALEQGELAAIVVASPRAATALIAARGHAVLPEVWAVGPATHRVLVAAGIPAHQPETAHDGASLAHAMVNSRELAGKRVLFPRAEDGRLDAMSILRAASAEIVDVIAYRTVAADAHDPAIARGRDLLASGAAAVCIVFAPSQASALTAVVGPLAALPTQFAAIGDTTGAVLREAGIAHVAVATTPTPEGVAQAISAVYPPR
ncbi:MAG: uroporphyrinogen-III synthase [Kofleriaceae bacterium]|nr:uroporphyrinogen-III synthase [Kofleriaceae bacterium]